MTEPRLVTHMEKYLGPIAGGGRLAGDGPTVHVVAFEEGPFANTSCYCTLGLSHHRLRATSGKVIRMELLMMVRRTPQTKTAPGILADVGEELLRAHEPLLRGEVIGPRGPLWDHTRLEALYATSPAYLPDDSAEVELEDGDRCVIAWLVPITANESAYVRAHGWRAFEDILVLENPDLLAADREDLRSIGVR